MSLVEDLIREQSKRRGKRIVFWGVLFVVSLIGSFEHWQILEINGCDAAVIDYRFWGLTSTVVRQFRVSDRTKVKMSYYGGRPSNYLEIYNENEELLWRKYFANWDGGMEEKRKICHAISNCGRYRTSTLIFGMIVVTIASAFKLIILLFTGVGCKEITQRDISSLRAAAKGMKRVKCHSRLLNILLAVLCSIFGQIAEGKSQNELAGYDKTVLFGTMLVGRFSNLGFYAMVRIYETT